uniref:Protein kinase domain-containing protein n=1 Tax=Maylandia zebra TaxID=106582 RepID=A0A3P9CFM1_9CICH
MNLGRVTELIKQAGVSLVAIATAPSGTKHTHTHAHTLTHRKTDICLSSAALNKQKSHCETNASQERTTSRIDKILSPGAPAMSSLPNSEFSCMWINKVRPDILQQAKLETFILEQLPRLDPDTANIVNWNVFFHDGQWVCLNFELLDQCLWDYIGDQNNQGLPISEVRPILRQLTNALSHLGSVGIVHADLKPGNIMVVNRHESPVKVRLIDFGLACPASAVNPSDCVRTVGYSAPEVMLGLPYNEASDMWFLGLVAVELATGVPLYPAENEYDYLKFIIETQGQPPDHVLDSGIYADDYYIEDNYNTSPSLFRAETQTERDVSASVKAPQVVHKQTKPSYSHWHSLTFDSQRNAALTRLSMTAHSLTLS